MPPKQQPWLSNQVVCTPPEFLSAVKKRLFINDFGIDLAASKNNRVTDLYYDEEMNSLEQPWLTVFTQDKWCFCNPPYSDIALWVEKCRTESIKGAKIACLVPSSTGSNWWAKYVNGSAYITYLNGRIKFVGHKNYYPKDLALLLYAPYLDGGSCMWKWTDDVN